MNLRLIIIGIAFRNLLHRLGIGLGAGEMPELVVVDINHRERIDIVAFALRLGTYLLSLGDRRCTFGKIFRGRRYMGIPKQTQRNTPVGHAARRISLQDCLEFVLRRAVPERMLIKHSTVEQLLRFGRARCLEMHGAELVDIRLRQSRRRGDQCSCGECHHSCGGYFAHGLDPL
jgi:hypothetical protein